MLSVYLGTAIFKLNDSFLVNRELWIQQILKAALQERRPPTHEYDEYFLPLPNSMFLEKLFPCYYGTLLGTDFLISECVSDLTQHIMGISGFKIILYIHSQGQFQLILNQKLVIKKKKLVIVSHTRYMVLPRLEIFQSKIPVVTTGWHSRVFAMNSSLCKHSPACKSSSFSMGHIELLYREFVGTRTLTPNMSLKWSSL